MKIDFKILLILFLVYSSLQSRSQNDVYIPFGDAFTPNGKLKALVVFAGYEGDCDSSEATVWPNYRLGETPCKTFPNYLDNLFFSDESEFDNNDSVMSLSNYYYQASDYQFKFMADVYPERINIPGEAPANRWYTLRTGLRQVMDTLKSQLIENKYPDFNLSEYDNRKNKPSFKFDNSLSEPDGIIDYLIVIFRVKGEGGVASSINYTLPFGDTTMRTSAGSGFTVTMGNGNIYTNFIHEVAHTIFACPHVFGVNGTIGHYFYTSHGWSIMRFGWMINGPNAWERWMLGWVDDADSSNLVKTNALKGIYTLRDHYSTGDYLKIEIPNTSPIQYLWLENHAGKTLLDDRYYFDNDAIGNFIPRFQSGVLAYTEALNASRSKKLRYTANETNGLLAYHREGNFDFTVIVDSIEKNNYEDFWYGNRVPNIYKGESNPLVPQNKLTPLRHNWPFQRDLIQNKNLDTSRIQYTTHYNNGVNEGIDIIKLNGKRDYGSLGHDAAFQPGDKIGVSHHSVVLNHQKFDERKQSLSPVILNGISVEVLERLSDGSVKIRVRTDDFEIVRNQRFTGHVLLKDNLNVNQRITLKLNKSGMPNRTTKGKFVNKKWEYPDFINPTVMVIDSGAVLKLEKKSTFEIINGSTLIIKKGGTLHIGKRARVDIDNHSFLGMEEGANIFLERKGKLNVESTRVGKNPKANDHFTNYKLIESVKTNRFEVVGE